MKKRVVWGLIVAVVVGISLTGAHSVVQADQFPPLSKGSLVFWG